MSEPTLQDLFDSGWWLIPIGRNKRPLVSWKRYQEIRPTWEEILAWEQQKTPAIWAGITDVSGRITLDFDGETGCATMRSLGIEPHRATPSGGFHADFVPPGWRVPTVNGKSKVELGERWPGLDLRATGGYINLLGATDKGYYQWLRTDVPHLIDAVPEDLARFLGLAELPSATPVRASSRVKPAKTTPAPSSEPPPLPADQGDLPYGGTVNVLLGEALRQARTGRNEAGFWLACQLRDHRLSYQAAAEVMGRFAGAVPQTDTKGHVEPYTTREAIASLDQAWRSEPRDPWLPTGGTITVNNRQQRDVSNDAMNALLAANSPPRLFTRDGVLSRIEYGGDRRPRLEPVTADALRSELSLAADWVKVTATGELRAVYVPNDIARDVLATSPTVFPPIRQVIDTPCLRSDGSILATAGYDPVSELYLHLNTTGELPASLLNPTREDVDRAVSLLTDELLGEFCFVDSASKANALALVLSPILRPAFEGPVPLALIDAPVANSGKTLLAEITSLLACGQLPALTSAPTGNEEELRKRITSLLLTDPAVIVVDNVARQLDSSVLAQALTATRWGDRQLGFSRMLNLEQRAIWAATGNNIQIGGDLPRRCYLIQLDPLTARPWLHAFKRTDLVGWVTENRTSLIGAALTLGRWWFTQGCPHAELAPWGSFYRWTAVVGGVLAAAGIPDFLANRDTLQTVGDAEGEAWKLLLESLETEFGDSAIRSKEIAVHLHSYELKAELPRLLSESLSTAQSEPARVTRIGKYLRTILGRRFDETGLRLEDAGTDSTSKARLWRVRRDPSTDNDQKQPSCQTTH